MYSDKVIPQDVYETIHNALVKLLNESAKDEAPYIVELIKYLDNRWI